MEMSKINRKGIEILSNQGAEFIRDWAAKGVIDFDLQSNRNTLGAHNIFVTVDRTYKDDRWTLDELYHVGTPIIQDGLNQAFVEVANQLATNGGKVRSLTPEMRALKVSLIHEFARNCQCFEVLKPLVSSFADDEKAKEIYGDRVSQAYALTLRLASFAAGQELAPEMRAEVNEQLMKLVRNPEFQDQYLPPLLLTLQKSHASDPTNPELLPLVYKFLQAAVAQHHTFLTKVKEEGTYAIDGAALEKRIVDDATVERMLTTLQKGGNVDAGIVRGKLDALVSWCQENSTLTPPYYLDAYAPFTQSLTIGVNAAKQFTVAGPSAGLTP